jgi:hypothetical protein
MLDFMEVSEKGVGFEQKELGIENNFITNTEI